MIGLDCNILVQLAFTDHPDHARAVSVVQREVDDGELLVFSSLIVAEFLHVVTDPRRFDPPLTMTEALDWIEELLAKPSVRLLEPTPESTQQSLRWLRQFNLGRKRILDTHFAAGVAHEIGNPLNSLNIHLQLLDRETRDLPADKRAAFKESVRVARAEVARLDKIINDFLRAARPAPPRRRNKRRVGADVKRLGRLSERPLWQRQERRLSSTRRTHSNAEAVGRGRVIREMDFTVCASVKTWVVEE